MKKKKERRIEDQTSEKKRPNLEKKGKKKKRVKGQKLWPWVPPYVFNYKNVIEL